MLDKTVPYFHVIMRRPAGLSVPDWTLPQPFTLNPYRDGDDVHWAAIEAAVGEFETASAAEAYFHTHYRPYRDELPRRVLFVRAADGPYVGTVTAWWNMTAGRRDASLHWLAVDPAYQHRGIGRALVAACLHRLIALEGDRPIWLHTQTWSHTAVRIYLAAGFRLVATDTFGPYPNEYRSALTVLRHYVPEVGALDASSDTSLEDPHP